jgi:cell division protease FtsH
MTGADIERVVREAKQKARREKRPLTYFDIESRILGSRPKISAGVRWRTSVHEAGHAVAWTATGRAKVLKLTTGQREGGETVARVDEDVHQTEEWVMDIITCVLSGRAAEQFVFGDFSIGSGGPDISDLAHATRLASQLETVTGISVDRPLLHIPILHLGQDVRLDRELGNRINSRLEVAYARAFGLVNRFKEPMLQLAEELNSKFVLEEADILPILSELLPHPTP